MLVLSTKSQFDSLMYGDDVISKASTICGEYITALYYAGALIAERIVYGNTIEHFIVTADSQADVVTKTSKLPA
jgi:hypothetical protein